MSYSQRDFHEDWRRTLNDRRQVFMLGDTIAAFVAGAALAAFVLLGILHLTGGL